MGDLNGDGYPDIVAANRMSTSYYCLNDGKLHFDCRPLEHSPSAATVLIADVDGDGKKDIVYPCRDSCQSLVYFNDGKGNFTRAEKWGPANSSIRATAVADFDGDGHLDIAACPERLGCFVYFNQCVPHMRQILEAARKTGIRVFYAMHRRCRPGDYETWKYIGPIQKAAWSRKSFEYGTWAGEIRAGFEPRAGDVVVAEHWCSSGFANTDLDLQLKKHGIHKLIVIGLIAHICVEATVRYAAELGYDVTVVNDATASYSDEHMHAALEINIPNYASAIKTTDEAVGALASFAGMDVPAVSRPAIEMRSGIWVGPGQQRFDQIRLPSSAPELTRTTNSRKVRLEETPREGAPAAGLISPNAASGPVGSPMPTSAV